MNEIEKNATDNSYLIVMCGSYSCAIPTSSVSEILPLPALAQPPQTPPIVAGFLDIGGTATIIVDLAVILGDAPSAPGFYWNIVRMRQDVPPMGYLVERAERVVRISGESIRNVSPDESLNGCVTGEFQDGEDCVHILDVEQILLAKERQVLERLQADYDRRVEMLSVEAPQ